MTLELRALKRFTYATRKLEAGDVFYANTKLDAQLLIAIGKAESHRTPGHIDPPPAALLAQIDPDPVVEPIVDDGLPAGDDMAALRAEYTEKVGKRPFNGWDAVTLRERIAAAGNG